MKKFLLLFLLAAPLFAETKIDPAQVNPTAATLTGSNVFTVAQRVSATASATTSLTGAVLIGNNTAATNVGIGGGNVNAGGTITAGGAIIPSQTVGITGTTTNNNVGAGGVGEYMSNSSTAVSLTTNTSANAGTITLTAGDWDVTIRSIFYPASGTTTQYCIFSISTTSGTDATFPSGNQGIINSGGTPAGNTQFAQSWGPVRFSVSGSTPIYCVEKAGFTGSTMTADGYITARRVRE